eukprot:5474795-Karenia_brevis.AAC.1
MCTDSECCGIRRVGVRHCYRCGQPTALRPPRAGDVIPGGTADAVDPEVEQADAADPLAGTGAGTTQAAPAQVQPESGGPAPAEVTLPLDFRTR